MAAKEVRFHTDARERFREPRQLLIFPEGTRQPPGAEPNYKPGVAGIYRDLDTFDLRENALLGPQLSLGASYGSPELGADFRAFPLSAAASWAARRSSNEILPSS